MSALTQKQFAKIILALIAIHLAIVLPLAYILNIWSDEASTLYATQRGFWVAFQTAAIEQKQAPLYFWLLSLWRYLNDSIFFARLFSIVCSVASIWLFSGLTKRIFSSKTAVRSTAFFALHPILIWASLETRVYALVILLSITLISLFLRGFWETGENKLMPKLWLTLLAIIALYTNYYLGFVLAGLLVALLVTRQWRPALSYIMLMMIAAVAFLPMVVMVRSELISRSTSFTEPSSLTTGLRTIWSSVVTYILPADTLPGGDESTLSIVRLWTVRFAVALTGVVTLFRWRRASAQTIALGAILGTVLAFMLLAYFLVGSWLIELRHATVFFAPLILFLTSLISDIFQPADEAAVLAGRTYVPALAAVVLSFFTYSLVSMYPGLTKPGNWEQVAKYVEQHETSDQPIIIFHTYEALALPYYYRGKNKIYPDERFFDFDIGSDTAERIEKRTAFTISKIPRDAPELWLVTSDECDRAGVCESFNNFVDSNYDRISVTDLRDRKVTLLRKKTDETALASRIP